MGEASPGHPWPPPAHRITIRVTHTGSLGGGAALPTAAVVRRIDGEHTNPFALWTGRMRNVSSQGGSG